METREQARIIHATMRQIRNRVLRHYTQVAKDLCDLTLPQMNMLLVIRDRANLTIKEIAVELQVSAPSASVMVDRLVELGMARREHGQVDRREVFVRVTEEGLDSVETLENHVLQTVVELLERLGPDVSRQWCDLFEQIQAILQHDPPSDAQASGKEQANP